LSEALTGLALFPEETRYFAKDIISPYRCKGICPEDKNFRIYMYQLNTEPCPHIDKLKNSTSCKIYEDRPLICRCYPFTPLYLNELGEPITQADPACMSLKDIKDKNTRIEISIRMDFLHIICKYMGKI
jgi:Fe-S-cluster containining protein